MFKNTILLIVFSIITSGCVLSSTRNIKDTDKIDNGNGILIVRIHINSSDTEIKIQKDNSSIIPIFVADLSGINAHNDLRVVEVPSGKLKFHSIRFSGLASGSLGNIKEFYVEPNTVTYIGDITINVTLGYSNLKYRYFVTDNETPTMQQIRYEYPWLLKKYKYKKSLAKVVNE